MMKKMFLMLMLFSLVMPALSHAKEIGKVANLVGTLTRTKADGTVITCKLQDVVEESIHAQLPLWQAQSEGLLEAGGIGVNGYY